MVHHEVPHETSLRVASPFFLFFLELFQKWVVKKGKPKGSPKPFWKFNYFETHCMLTGANMGPHSGPCEGACYADACEPQSKPRVSDGWRGTQPCMVAGIRLGSFCMVWGSPFLHRSALLLTPLASTAVPLLFPLTKGPTGFTFVAPFGGFHVDRRV